MNEIPNNIPWRSKSILDTHFDENMPGLMAEMSECRGGKRNAPATSRNVIAKMSNVYPKPTCSRLEPQSGEEKNKLVKY